MVEILSPPAGERSARVLRTAAAVGVLVAVATLASAQSTAYSGRAALPDVTMDPCWVRSFLNEAESRVLGVSLHCGHRDAAVDVQFLRSADGGWLSLDGALLFVFDGDYQAERGTRVAVQLRVGRHPPFEFVGKWACAGALPQYAVISVTSATVRRMLEQMEDAELITYRVARWPFRQVKLPWNMGQMVRSFLVRLRVGDAWEDDSHPSELGPLRCV